MFIGNGRGEDSFKTKKFEKLMASSDDEKHWKKQEIRWMYKGKIEHHACKAHKSSTSKAITKPIKKKVGEKLSNHRTVNLHITCTVENVVS